MNPTARDSSDYAIGLIASHTTPKLLTLFVLASGAALALAPAPVFAQDAGYSCTDRSGGTTEIQAALTSVRFAHHDGYDRIVFGFANAPAVPTYRITQQGSATFFVDSGLGGTRTLEGSAGVRTVFDGTLWTDGVPLADARPELPLIREVASVGNWEGVTSYGIGVSQRACFRTLELTSPARLVIDFAFPSDRAASNSPVALAQTGHSASAVNVAAPASDNRTLLPAGLGALLLAACGALLATRGRRIQRLRSTSRGREVERPCR